MGRDFTDKKDGDSLEPVDLNIIYRELRRLRKLRGVGRVTVSGMGDGQSVPEIDVTFPPPGYVGVANGAITARSGTTAGTGTVTIKQLNGTTLATAQANDLTVYNASADTMTSGDGIDDGMYVWVQRDAFGDWWVSPLECS